MRYENVRKQFVQKRLDRRYALEACIDVDKDTHDLNVVYTLEVLAINKDTMKCTDIANMNGMSDLRPASIHMSEKELAIFLVAFALIDEQKALKMLYEDENEGAWERVYYGNISSELVLSIDTLEIDGDEERLCLVAYPSAKAQDEADDQFQSDRVMAVISTSVNDIFEMSAIEFMREQDRLRKIANKWGSYPHDTVDITDYFTDSELAEAEEDTDFMDDEDDEDDEYEGDDE